MTELPTSLEEAIAQSREATKAAIADGYTRLCVELAFPELKVMPVAWQFLPTFEQWEERLKVFFPDAGAAALARRDWGRVPFKIEDIGTLRTSIEGKIEPEDEIFLFIEPSSVEVNSVDKLSQVAGSRPLVLLNPRLEDAGTIGIGYAARQLRERFINTLESCYYIRPLEGAALFRCYPAPWQVWLETGDDYKLMAEVPKKPVGEELDRILFQPTGTDTSSTSDMPKPKKPGLFTQLQRFLRALSR